MIREKVNKILKLVVRQRVANTVGFFVLIFYIGETFIHPGIFVLPTEIPLIFYLIVNLVVYVFGEAGNKGVIYSRQSIKIAGYAIVAFLLTAALSLMIIEAIHYPNYVYSKFHIFTPNLFLLSSVLVVFMFFNNRYSQSRRITGGKKSWGAIFDRQIGFPLVYLLSSLLLLAGISVTVNPILGEIVASLRYSVSSYDDKMRFEWKNFYDFMQFINLNTSEDATILIPPKVEADLWEGTESLLRSFLYPRTIVKDQELKEGNISKLDYILFVGPRNYAKEGTIARKGWPDHKIEVKRILIFNGIYLDEGIYDPGDIFYQNKMGLLRL